MKRMMIFTLNGLLTVVLMVAAVLASLMSPRLLAEYQPGAGVRIGND